MKMEFSISVSWCDYLYTLYSDPIVAGSVDEIYNIVKEILPSGHYQDFEFEGWWLNDDGTEHDDLEYHFRYKPMPDIKLIDDKEFFKRFKNMLEKVFTTDIDVMKRNYLVEDYETY